MRPTTDQARDDTTPTAPGGPWTPSRRLARRAREVAPGTVLALAVPAAATPLGALVPVIGGPVFGIVLGIVVGVFLRPGARLRPGLDVAARPVLQTSIVVLGATLSLGQVAAVGLGSLPVMLSTLAVALLGAWGLGRLLGVRGDTGLLIGVGTGICGASAIAATSAVLRPREHEVAYAIGTIFTFNVLAVLTFPPLGHALGMDGQAFGLWAGTAVNDTSSVVAAAYSFGDSAGPAAVVVKLVRTLMIIPIVMVLAVWAARRDAASSPAGEQGGPARRRRLPWRRIVPPFLVGFLVASALDTVGVVPASWHAGLSAVGTFLITTALAGIGLGLRPADMRRAGLRPLALGACLWVLVAVSSLGLQELTGTL
ncbi:YeiH family protein [Actinomycetospora chlora]|uniref:YeiH family protein n=1 Tax=Actinomycetospora chlora TaxID=663608 RepID=A0ABP9B502_9PSEU